MSNRRQRFNPNIPYLPTPGQTDTSQSGDTSGQPELTERDYMIPIKDSHGHSDSVHFRMNPKYMPALNNIVRGKKFPFRSTNDVIRFGIDRVVRDLEQRAGIPTMLRQIDAIKDVLLHEENHIEFLSTFDRTQAIVQHYVNRGHPEQAAKVVASLKHHVEGMPDEHWRAEYMTELNTRFRHLLNVVPGEGENLLGGEQHE